MHLYSLVAFSALILSTSAANTCHVKFYNQEKGYGFCTPANGADVFVHHSELEKAGIRVVQAGQCLAGTFVKSSKSTELKNIHLC